MINSEQLSMVPGILYEFHKPNEGGLNYQELMRSQEVIPPSTEYECNTSVKKICEILLYMSIIYKTGKNVKFNWPNIYLDLFFLLRRVQQPGSYCDG